MTYLSACSLTSTYSGRVLMERGPVVARLREGFSHGFMPMPIPPNMSSSSMPLSRRGIISAIVERWREQGRLERGMLLWR